MTEQYLIGELSVRLERLQATTRQAAGDVARLRAEVESGPPSRLASATVRALALADDLCWTSLACGDGDTFARQAEISADLLQFGVCARLLTDK